MNFSKKYLLPVFLLAAGITLPLFAAENPARQKMVWAHYVPWHPAENNAFAAIKYLNAPYSDVLTDPLKDEVTLAREHGIEATAFYADEPLPYKYVLRRNRRREKLACIKAWLDINILHKKPKFVK